MLTRFTIQIIFILFYYIISYRIFIYININSINNIKDFFYILLSADSCSPFNSFELYLLNVFSKIYKQNKKIKTLKIR
jgi:hypothetical protein